MPSVPGAFPKDWRKTRERIFARDGRVCYWCGNIANTIDHLLPRAQGGTHDDANLVPACGLCNSRRGGQMAKAPRVKVGLPRARVSRWG